MGNITSTDSRRSGGSNNDILVVAAAAAVEGRPQKRIKLTTKTNDGNVSSPKHAASVSSNTRSSASGNGANKTDDDDIELTLPAECYSLVLEYLDYQTVLSCALTSKVFLYDAMPLVKTLHIDTALQMNIPLTSRFRDVTHINLYSLLRGRVNVDEEDEDNNEEILHVNYDAIIRVVPFLSAFPNLQRVFFGGRWIDGEIATFSSHGSHGMIRNEYEEESRNIHTLMDNISGSFQSAGGLLKSVQVMGLRCPHSGQNGNDDDESECKACIRACKSFPLDQVINFDNEGSSVGLGDLFSCKKAHFLDVCLSRSVIESIAEERPGGRDMLRSNARFFYLLGKGSLSEIRSEMVLCCPLSDIPARRRQNLNVWLSMLS